LWLAWDFTSWPPTLIFFGHAVVSREADFGGFTDVGCWCSRSRSASPCCATAVRDRRHHPPYALIWWLTNIRAVYFGPCHSAARAVQ
jgi:hypothetical protein